MVVKNSLKKNISSIQVLKTLKVLLQGNYTMQDLIKILNSDEKRPIFNNSLVSKYINTCRYCGINIHKIQNKYFVTSMPFGLELTGSDIDLLEILQNVVQQTMANKYNKVFNEFLEKLNRFSNKKITRVEKNTYHIFTELFEQAVKERRKIKLMLKDGSLLNAIPLYITEEKGKLFFYINCKNKDRIIDSNRITGLEVLREKYAQNFNNQVVVFELMGNLALRYNLREHEHLLKKYDGKSIVVSNLGESKELLLSRLLRYDDQCKIINLQNYCDDMLDIINLTLKNYGE